MRWNEGKNGKLESDGEGGAPEEDQSTRATGHPCRNQVVEGTIGCLQGTKVDEASWLTVDPVGQVDVHVRRTGDVNVFEAQHAAGQRHATAAVVDAVDAPQVAR